MRRMEEAALTGMAGHIPVQGHANTYCMHGLPGVVDILVSRLLCLCISILVYREGLRGAEGISHSEMSQQSVPAFTIPWFISYI